MRRCSACRAWALPRGSNRYRYIAPCWYNLIWIVYFLISIQIYYQLQHIHKQPPFGLIMGVPLILKLVLIFGFDLCMHKRCRVDELSRWFIVVLLLAYLMLPAGLVMLVIPRLKFQSFPVWFLMLFNFMFDGAFISICIFHINGGVIHLGCSVALRLQAMSQRAQAQVEVVEVEGQEPRLLNGGLPHMQIERQVEIEEEIQNYESEDDLQIVIVTEYASDV